MRDCRSIALLLACAVAAFGFQAKKRPAIEQKMMVLRVPVPDLFGQNLDQATATLRAAHLRPGTQSFAVSTQPIGTVVSQEPARGTMVSAGSAVNLVFAQPPNPSRVIVPDLHTQTVGQARITLSHVELRLGEIQGRPSPEPQGTIVDQNPPPQSPAPPGALVHVWIAAPMPVNDVGVPDLTGLTPPQAAGRLGETGLVLGQQVERESGAAPGTIVDQDPRPGARAPRSSPVNVWLAAAVAPPPAVLVTVPDVRGLHVAAAAALIRQAGLRVGSETRLRSNQPALTVLSQSPPPDTQVGRGDAVALEISEGVPAAPPPPPPSRTRITPVMIVSGVALAAAAVLLAGKFLKRDPNRAARPEQPVRLHPLPEPGTQTLSTEHLVQHDSVVRLALRPDPGKQTAIAAPPPGKRKESP